ncbi:CocE/NonD family hydrolase [Streptomyces sp. NPDC127033]|uniref:CocE/NonD family hydrolase n=1 Tax=Streptomyces sp. NPDC127033 TaxID=3347110 RepID=UPI0036601A96
MVESPGRDDGWQAVPEPGSGWRQVVQVPMRDGAALVADVYAAGPDPAPRPVLLERTPYGRRTARGSDGAFESWNPPPPEAVCRRFVERGYHVVRQDCRGRGDSGGTFVKYLNEAEDGYDTVEWIAAQPWCDGRVATMGVSYAAHAQSALASLGTPSLSAMFLDSGGFASAYETGVRLGGAFELKQATWAFARARTSAVTLGDPVRGAALESESIEEWFRHLPWRRGHSPLRHAPEYEDYLFEQWEHGRFGPYWRQLGIYGRGRFDQFPDVPSLHISSWYDPYIRTAVENFHELGTRKTSPAYLVLGPWTHGRRSVSYAGDVDFGPEAPLDGNLAADYAEFRADWFDARLSSAPPRDPAVRYFRMGGGSGRRTAEGRLDHGGRWLAGSTWPPEHAHTAEFRLTADGGLTVEPGELTPEPGALAGYLEYDHDPRDPVPTIGGQVTSGEPVMAGGAFDQRPDDRTYSLTGSRLPLASRPDVLTFQTAPLERDVVVAGPVVARLTVSSTAVDTDFTVKLIDVHPPSADYPVGFAMNLTDGILRCRYRDSFESPSPLEPGRLYDVTVHAPDTANLFARGHRIRVDISSSNFPRFDVNSGTGAPETTDRRRVVATNRVYVDGRSTVTLHVLTGEPA